MNLTAVVSLFRPTKYFHWHRQISQLAREKNINRIDVLQALLRLRFSTGLGWEEYRYYGLYDPTKPWSWKATYVAEGDMQRMWRILNPEEYWSLFNNKLIFNRYFGAVGLPVARILGIYDPVFGSTYDARLLQTEEQLTELLLQRQGTGFVLKHVEGERGNEVYVFTEVEPQNARPLIHVDGRRFAIAELLGKLSKAEESRKGCFRHTWLIEERLQPHLEIARLSGPTLSCMRLQTLVEDDCEPQIIASMIKIPAKPRAVDNLHFGGVAIWIDPETGILGRGRIMQEVDINWLTSLPWNGIEFNGTRLPFWEEAKSLTLRAAAAFPWTRCIGWDVAITPDGPVLIEGNERFSVRLVQAVAPQGLLTDSVRKLYSGTQNAAR